MWVVSMQHEGWKILNMAQGRISKIEKAMGAISWDMVSTSFQTKHLKEQLFNILDATMGENWKVS